MKLRKAVRYAQPSKSVHCNVRYGSRLCENAKAINRNRTIYSFKSVLGALIAGDFNFEIELKNIILVALRTSEFSHSLGQEQTCAGYPITSSA
jgi:hypothetical protein